MEVSLCTEIDYRRPRAEWCAKLVFKGGGPFSGTMLTRGVYVLKKVMVCVRRSGGNQFTKMWL